MSDPQRTHAELIELLLPDQLLVVWGDGHESLFAHRWLRERCGCARCVDEVSGAPLLDPRTLPADLRLTSWEATGRYGVNLHFSDRHRSGIYQLRVLRDHCPCPECQASATSSAAPTSSTAPRPQQDSR